MELNHLKYFYFVAREGGFSNASRAIKIAQPAITKMVKNLEAELNIQLFERTGKTVRLTKVGNDIYRKCEVIFGHVDDIYRYVDGDFRQRTGNVNIGAVDVIATHLATPVLATMRQKYPKIYPQITSATAASLCNLVSERKLDLALLFHAPNLPSSLEVRATYPVKFHLVVATAKKSHQAVLSSFIGSREVDDVGNKHYPTLTKLRRTVRSAEITISTNVLSAHRELVLAGAGVSILPEFLIKEDLRTRRMTTLLKEEDFTFKMKLISRLNEPLSEGASLFVELFESNLRGICK